MQSVFDTDKFISTIQSFPQLWDKSDPEYADKLKKESTWGIVMNSMFGEEGIEKLDIGRRNEMAKDIRKKWRNLRSSFVRELSRRKNYKSGSGRSWKTYTYFDQLTFLTASIAHAEIESSIANEENATEVSAEMKVNDTPVTLPETRPMSSKRKCSRSDPEGDLAAVLVKSLRWKQKNEEVLANDPDRLFLLSLLDDFKKVPSSRKADVKVVFIKAINDATYPQNSSPSPHTSHNFKKCLSNHRRSDISPSSVSLGNVSSPGSPAVSDDSLNSD